MSLAPTAESLEQMRQTRTKLYLRIGVRAPQKSQLRLYHKHIKYHSRQPVGDAPQKRYSRCMENLLRQAAERATRYLNGVQTRNVAPTPEALDRLRLFREPMPDGPADPEDVLEMLDTIGSPATTGMAGARFFGFVIGGTLPAALAANWLATAWDQNPGLHLASPVATELEEISLAWLLDVLQLPAECAGSFVTGATVANFTALAAARNAVLRDVGWNVEAKGLFGAPEITVVIGAEGHPSMVKALGMLGLGRERLVRVPVDEQGRMRKIGRAHV